MKAGAGVVHIFDFICRIKPIQYRFYFGSILGLRRKNLPDLYG
jgi:hypothetical protein